MNRFQAGGVVLSAGLLAGLLGVALGDGSIWALLLVAALLAGLAEIGGG